MASLRQAFLILESSASFSMPSTSQQSLILRYLWISSRISASFLSVSPIEIFYLKCQQKYCSFQFLNGRAQKIVAASGLVGRVQFIKSMSYRQLHNFMSKENRLSEFEFDKISPGIEEFDNDQNFSNVAEEGDPSQIDTQVIKPGFRTQSQSEEACNPFGSPRVAPEPRVECEEAENWLMQIEVDRKQQPLFTNTTRPTLPIQVSEQVQKAHDETLHKLKTQNSYTKDALYYICTRIACYFSQKCNMKVNRREKKGKPKVGSGDIQINGLEQQAIAKFSDQSKTKGDFLMLRTFFGYPDKIEEDAPIQEKSTEYDNIRCICELYLNSKETSWDFFRGRFGFSKKLFMIKQLDIIRNFPVGPSSCTCFSREVGHTEDIMD